MDNKTWMGGLAEAKVASALIKDKWEVFVGWGGKTTCDLIAVKNGRISRVQVKGCATQGRSGSWQVQLRSIRSNRTANTVYKFDSSKCEILGIYIEPEDRVIFYDASVLHGRSGINIKPMESTAEWSATGFEIRGG